MNTPKTDALVAENFLPDCDHSQIGKHRFAKDWTVSEVTCGKFIDLSRQLETQVQVFKQALQRGMELCERGHGHEWSDEARAILEKTK